MARADGYLQASWATLLFYQLSLACSKISILLLYLRVLTYNWARRAAWVLFAIIAIYSTLYFISTVTLCVPLEALWNPAVEGSCHRSPLIMWLAIGFHIVTDFLMFALPLPVIVLMTMVLSQRLMLLLIFALGFLCVGNIPFVPKAELYNGGFCCLTCLSSSACLISLLRAILMKPILGSTDFSWDFVPIAHWTSAEVNAAILCACLLATKPLISLLWSKLRRVRGLPEGQTTLGSSPPTIGSDPIRGSNLPSSVDGLERGHWKDRFMFSATEAESSAPPTRNVGQQQYSVGMEELTPVQPEKLDV
jgi:hypothetical protein